MFRTTLLAATAASALAVTPALAEPTIVKTWLNGPMPVQQLAFPNNGKQKCWFSQIHPNGDEFGVNQWPDGSISLSLAYKQEWTTGGIITLTVDSGVPFTPQASVRPSGSSHVLRADIPNEGAGRDFLHDLWNGQTLHVNAGPMVADFPLAGSATAILKLHQCGDAIATTQTATAAPAATQPFNPATAPAPAVTQPVAISYR